MSRIGCICEVAVAAAASVSTGSANANANTAPAAATTPHSACLPPGLGAEERTQYREEKKEREREEEGPVLFLNGRERERKEH